jgi:hypothetical protein
MELCSSYTCIKQLLMRGVTMPIYELLKRQGGVFGPEDVAMLGQVFEDVMQTLSFIDRGDPMAAEMVAKKLVELATSGMRDPERLKATTVQAFVYRQAGQ